MGLDDKIFQCFSLRPKVCESLRKLVNIVFFFVVFFSIICFLAKFNCNIMSIRDVNLCASLNTKRKSITTFFHALIFKTIKFKNSRKI